MQETWVRSLGWEDPLRQEWQPSPVFLPGKSQRRQRSLAGQSIGSQRIRHDWAWPHTLKLKILIWSSPESINVYSKILSLWTSKRIGYTRSKSLRPIFRKKWWYKWYSLLYNNPLDSYFKVLPAGQILARKDNLLSCFYCIAVQGKIWIWKMSNITDCQ